MSTPGATARSTNSEKLSWRRKEKRNVRCARLKILELISELELESAAL